MNMGPLNFNTLGDAQHPYVQTKYSSSYNNPNSIGITGSGNASSHGIITSNTPDPCRCYTLNGSTYIHENYMPPLWNMDYSAGHQDTVIRVGCGTSNSICNRAAQIEYWFYPEDSLGTLLVMFTFALQNCCTPSTCSHGVDQGCGSIRNPQFYIEVYDGETNQLLNLGYYPTKESEQAPTKIPNPNWPYSRFLAWPSGCSANQDSQNPTNDQGITTYYWAGQNGNGYATPTTFNYMECPSNQTQGNSSSYPVQWFEYKPLAFNLNKYAKMNWDTINHTFVPNKSVKLRIRTVGCSATAHWAYGLFTAKMIPGVMQVDACGDEDIHLSVPAGFIPNTYEWHYGYDSADASTHFWDFTADPVPGVTPEGQNGVYLNRNLTQIYPYYRCEMISYTGAPFIYEAHVKSYYVLPEFRYEQSFENCDLTVNFYDSSTIYVMTPPTIPPSQGGTYDTVIQPTQHIQWWVKRYGNFIPFGNLNQLDPVHTFIDGEYDENGIATIKIAISDSAKKCHDTLVKTIQLDLSAIENSFGSDTIYTCEEKLPYVFDPEYFGDTQTWSTEGTRRVTYEGRAWNGCDSLADITLIIRKPKVSIVFDLDYCDEFTTTLSAVTDSEVAEYKWNTGETTPNITITTPGNYSVVVVDDEGCVSDPPGTINIPACKPFLNLANTITPSNLDGINDYFSIPQKNLIQELEFTVYNRSGEIVYHTTNKDFQWNGSVNGKILSGATYTYTLYIVDYEGVSSNHKGSITVL
jgi:gliding motility-associated-like protein